MTKLRDPLKIQLRNLRNRKERERIMSSHFQQQTNNPRLPSAARPYKAPITAPQDLPVDYSGFIAVIFGVFGAMFRYKFCSWLAIIFSAQAMGNMRNFENDFKQISMAMMFGIMGLTTKYLGMGPKASQNISIG